MITLLRTLAILLLLATAPISAVAADQLNSPTMGGATVTGQVLLPDKSPMTNGIALLFAHTNGPPPHPHKYWRIPDAIMNIGSDGKFALPLPNGTFYLMIAQKNPEADIGPPSSSEYLYVHAAADGTPRPLTVKTGDSLDLGTLTARLWAADLSQRASGITAVEGVIRDLEGHPVEKAVVFAYVGKRASGRPLYVSDRTGKDGGFQLRVAEGGTYYLRVRSILGGGAPKAGEYLNTTDEFTPTAVTLQTNQILRNVNLPVKRFARPTESTGKELRNMQKLDKLP